MLTHDIIVCKEPEIVGTRYPVMQYSGATTVQPFPNIKDQADLDRWVANSVLNINDYVTFISTPLMPTQIPHSVWLLRAKQTDFEKLQRTKYSPYNPQLVKLQVLPTKTSMNNMYEKWDDIRSLRRISEDEWTRLVKPYLDSLRDHS